MKGMSGSMFGIPAADLEAGARNAVEVWLAIQPDERVALIADEASGDVAASLAAPPDEGGAPRGGAAVGGGAPGRHRAQGALRSELQVGKEERPDQPPLLVEPAGGRSVHDAEERRRRVRLRRHRGRLLRPEVRRPALDAAHARDR